MTPVHHFAICTAGCWRPFSSPPRALLPHQDQLHAGPACCGTGVQHGAWLAHRARYLGPIRSGWAHERTALGQSPRARPRACTARFWLVFNSDGTRHRLHAAEKGGSNGAGCHESKESADDDLASRCTIMHACTMHRSIGVHVCACQRRSVALLSSDGKNVLQD